MRRTLGNWFLRLVAFTIIEILFCSPPLQALAHAAARTSSPAGNEAQHVLRKARPGLSNTARPAANEHIRAKQRRQIRSTSPDAPSQRATPGVVPLVLTPAEVKRLGDGSAETRFDAWALFDGDLSTALTSRTGLPQRFEIALSGRERIGEVAVFGGTRGVLSFHTASADGKKPIAGLAELTAAESSRWTRFVAASPVHTESLIVEWQPSAELGPTEIRLFGAGAPDGVGERAAADRVLSGG